MRAHWFLPCLCLGWSAYAGPRRHDDTALAVERISASSDGYDIFIDIELPRGELERLRAMGLQPVLTVSGDAPGTVIMRTHVDIPLRTNMTHGNLPVPRSCNPGVAGDPFPCFPRTLTIGVSSQNSRGRLDWLDVGAAVVESLDVRIDATAQHLPPPVLERHWAGDPDVIRACGAAFVGSSNSTTCTEKVDRAPESPVETIVACDGAFVSNADVLSCLSNALDTPHQNPPPEVIVACDEAMVGSADTLQCIRDASPAAAPRSLVSACDQAFGGTSETLQCIQSAAPSTHPPADWIPACDRATVSSTSTLKCVAAASLYRSNPAPTIEACGDASTGDAAIVTCIERGTR